MSKVAKLVYISLATRVVVDENASEDEILNAASVKFIEKITNEIQEHIEEIVDDEECPFDPEFDN
jgi:hypothetical protein